MLQSVQTIFDKGTSSSVGLVGPGPPDSVLRTLKIQTVAGKTGLDELG